MKIKKEALDRVILECIQLVLIEEEERTYTIPQDPDDPSKGTWDTKMVPNSNEEFYTGTELQDLYAKGGRLEAPPGISPDIFKTAVDRVRNFASDGAIIYKTGPEAARLVNPRREPEPEAPRRPEAKPEPTPPPKPRKKLKLRKKKPNYDQPRVDEREDEFCPGCLDWHLHRVLNSPTIGNALGIPKGTMTQEEMEGLVRSGELDRLLADAENGVLYNAGESEADNWRGNSSLRQSLRFVIGMNRQRGWDRRRKGTNINTYQGFRDSLDAWKKRERMKRLLDQGHYRNKQYEKSKKKE